MMEAGFTKEQIVEGWDDMMKAVADRRHQGMKTGEKRQGAKGEIEKTATGVKHTRRYDKKTGETDTGSDGEQVKRGRGRPKKHAFESRSMATNMIVETFTKLFDNAAPIQPKDAAAFMKSSDPNIFNKLSGTKPTTTTGTVKQGTWQADAPKAGEKPVPVPQNPEVAKEGDEPDLKSALGRAAGRTAGLIHAVPRAAYGAATGDTGGTKIQAKTADGAINAFKQGWSDTNPYNIKQAFNDKEVAKEADMEEGNAFSGAVAKAKADGVQPGETIKVGGKTYPVKEGEELLQMLRIAGIKVLEDTQLDECGMSSMGNGMMGQHEQEGRMNVSTNMSSDGTKSVTITADGNSATELMQMLKLAGMGGGDHSEMPAEPESEPEGIMVVSHGDEEEVAEEKDERYHANTTPEEHVMPVQVQTKGGNGDVAGREKKMTPNGYQFGDNPHAMKESMSLKLIKEYENIKVKK